MRAGHPNRDARSSTSSTIPAAWSTSSSPCSTSCSLTRTSTPALTRNLGNIALLRIAGELGLVPPAIGLAAADAYREYRRLQHQVRLTGAPHARVDAGPQRERRAAVAALWSHVFGAPRS